MSDTDEELEEGMAYDGALEDADPGIPSSMELGEALFGETRRITKDVTEGTTVKEHLVALEAILIDKITLYGLHARRSYNSDVLMQDKKSVDKGMYPANNLWGHGRKWCFLCDACFRNKKLSVLAYCHVECHDGRRAFKPDIEMLSSMEKKVFVSVDHVFFHDKMCCDKTTTKYPKQCGVTTFNFSEIFGNTYERAVQYINAIDVGRASSNYPKMPASSTMAIPHMRLTTDTIYRFLTMNWK